MTLSPKFGFSEGELMDKLGERMKTYENVPKNYLTLGIPKVIRVDMRAGHTFCRRFERPFDDVFSNAMTGTAIELCKQIPKAVLAYKQSDEISIAINDENKDGTFNCFFDGNVEKITSVSASIATLEFNKAFANEVESLIALSEQKPYLGNLWKALFDSRVFCLPNTTELHNYFLWREFDAIRNSVQMVGHANFTQKELQNKNTDEILNMLADKNINWNALPTKYRRGVLIVKKTVPKEVTLPSGKTITVNRKVWQAHEMPLLLDNPCYIENLYNRMEPL